MFAQGHSQKKYDFLEKENFFYLKINEKEKEEKKNQKTIRKKEKMRMWAVPFIQFFWG